MPSWGLLYGENIPERADRIAHDVRPVNREDELRATPRFEKDHYIEKIPSSGRVLHCRSQRYGTNVGGVNFYSGLRGYAERGLKPLAKC